MTSISSLTYRWEGENMEAVTVITQLITNLGVPIAVMLILFWYINKREKAHDIEVTAMNTRLDENTARSIDAINNNTVILTKLYERMGLQDGNLANN